MCFVWISEQTAIISLYSTDWVVVITEAGRVYSAVRSGYLNVIQVNLCLRKLIVYKMTGAHLQPPHFQPSGISWPLLEESQLQSVRLPELHACVTAWTTPALVTAYMKAVSLLPAQTTQHTDNKFEQFGAKKRLHTDAGAPIATCHNLGALKTQAERSSENVYQLHSIIKQSNIKVRSRDHSCRGQT
jgi:hypothetical protein